MASANSFGVSGLMILHGTANAAYTVTKITITTHIAEVSGDDAADIAENNLPSTMIGIVLYGLAEMSDAVCNKTNRKDDTWIKAMGAIGDIIDFALGICMAKGVANSVESAMKELDGEKISELEKLIKWANTNKDFQIASDVYTFVSGIFQDKKTAV